MKIICNKCGATGSSKCPVLRTIFPTDQREAMFFMLVDFHLSDEEFKLSFRTQHTDMDEAALEVFKAIRSIPEEKLEQYCCNHEWEHTVDCPFCGEKIDDSE